MFFAIFSAVIAPNVGCLLAEDGAVAVVAANEVFLMICNSEDDITAHAECQDGDDIDGR